MSRRKDESELRRNTLSLRWSDQEKRLVTDAAWQRRTSCAAMIREIVLSRLHGDGNGGAA